MNNVKENFISTVHVTSSAVMDQTLYASKSELLEHVKAHYKQRGYILSIKRSDNHQHDFTMSCDRGGFYRNRLDLKDDTRKRKASTRLLGCPFELKAKGKVYADREEWRVLKVKDEHNHEADVDLIGHPVARRLTQEV